MMADGVGAFGKIVDEKRSRRVTEMRADMMVCEENF